MSVEGFLILVFFVEGERTAEWEHLRVDVDMKVADGERKQEGSIYITKEGSAMAPGVRTPPWEMESQTFRMGKEGCKFECGRNVGGFSLGRVPGPNYN